MTLLETNDIYYNTQVYFRNHYWDNMPNDDKVWALKYRRWLASQGCEIVHRSSTIPVVRNSLDVAPGYDYFGFKNEEDATVFVLKWS